VVWYRWTGHTSEANCVQEDFMRCMEPCAEHVPEALS
jgi:hypothetical protein